jgi:hypothetical protein
MNDWLIRRLPSWAREHPMLCAWIHFLSGLWLLALGAILYGYHRGGWWPAVLVPVGLIHFWRMFALQRYAESSRTLRSARS